MTRTAIVSKRPPALVRRVIVAGAVALWYAASGLAANAQGGGGVGSRIEAVSTGTVRMAFAARAGVCGDGWSWYRARPGSGMSGTVFNYNNGARDVEPNCQLGPVRVVVVRDGGETREIRTYVGGRWKADTGNTDLGTVSSADAARWLIGVAERDSERSAGAALSAAILADSVDAVSALLRIATNETRPTGVRTAALGWLGEVAGDRVAAKLDSMTYEPGDREVRKQAIYAISRRPVDEAVPSLLRMAETLPDRELRKTAVFWLARTKDPRALAWITKVVEAR